MAAKPSSCRLHVGVAGQEAGLSEEACLQSSGDCHGSGVGCAGHGGRAGVAAAADCSSKCKGRLPTVLAR